jgi:hypothetical protein
LFGYIDGGAELYLEYGFSEAFVTEISLDNARYRTEIFRMTGPEEAFGIFSVSRYKCTGTLPAAIFSCLSKYQLQFCKGSWYVSVTGRTTAVPDSTALSRIAGIISGKIREPDVDLSPFLPAEWSVQDPGGMILVKGRLGIVNGYPDLEDYFKNLSGYTALILDNKNDILVSVRFTDDQSFSEFLKLHGWEDLKIPGTGIKMNSGETIRLISQNHLLISIQKQYL